MELIAFYEFGVKDTIRLTRIDDNVLHVLIGLMLLVLIAAAFRRRLSSWLPFVAVAGIELLNEAADSVRWGMIDWGTGRDIVITLAAPLLLLLATRAFERLDAAPHALAPRPIRFS